MKNLKDFERNNIPSNNLTNKIHIINTKNENNNCIENDQNNQNKINHNMMMNNINNSNKNKCFINTTCGDKEYHSMVSFPSSLTFD